MMLRSRAAWPRWLCFWLVVLVITCVILTWSMRGQHTTQHSHRDHMISSWSIGDTNVTQQWTQQSYFNSFHFILPFNKEKRNKIDFLACFIWLSIGLNFAFIWLSSFCLHLAFLILPSFGLLHFAFIWLSFASFCLHLAINSSVLSCLADFIFLIFDRFHGLYILI